MVKSTVLGEAQREALESVLGHRFQDPTLLARAVTHASYVNQESGSSRVSDTETGLSIQPSGETHRALPTIPPEAPADYDRLEFLGDAVIAMVLAEEAYRTAPQASSGELTVHRARLARRGSLAAAAERLCLGHHARLSASEARQGGAQRTKLLADLFEAVVGALYLDGGLDVARVFLEQNLVVHPEGEAALLMETDDPKSRLQELLQGAGKPAPTYAVIEVTGPPHAPTFLVEVVVEGSPVARATGTSRREAEQAAARQALWHHNRP